MGRATFAVHDLRQVVETNITQSNQLNHAEPLLHTEVVEALVGAFEGRDWLARELRTEQLYLDIIDSVSNPSTTFVSARARRLAIAERRNL